MIIEAMKIEHTIAAPADGVVAQVLFARRDQVEEGEQLFQFDPISCLPVKSPLPDRESPSPLEAGLYPHLFCAQGEA